MQQREWDVNYEFESKWDRISYWHWHWDGTEPDGYRIRLNGQRHICGWRSRCRTNHSANCLHGRCRDACFELRSCRYCWIVAATALATWTLCSSVGYDHDRLLCTETLCGDTSTHCTNRPKNGHHGMGISRGFVVTLRRPVILSNLTYRRLVLLAQRLSKLDSNNIEALLRNVVKVVLTTRKILVYSELVA